MTNPAHEMEDNSNFAHHRTANNDALPGSSFGRTLEQFRKEGQSILGEIDRDVEQYAKLSWHGSFEQYLGMLRAQPEITRNAFQRLHDMIVSHGVRHEGGIAHYNIFDDPFNGGSDAVFGMDKQLARLVNIIKAGSEGYGPANRILLIHGPVGTAKSTIARLLKVGLEDYSRTDEGALYTFGFKIDKGHPEYDPAQNNQIKWCPMNEEPLHLIPDANRKMVEDHLNSNSGRAQRKVKIEQDLCPCCRQELRELMDQYKGDWRKLVSERIEVKRLVLSEKDRIGIGTFQPKDEKNQDATELTGDLNYRKIAKFGSDSDPRAFNFDGEFNISNRGLLEFVEVLKLEKAFLYDLLGATQERKIKSKKFAQTDIDEVIIAHTNEPEYLKLVSDKTMEAFRDRTIKIDVPYNLSVKDEQRIYEKSFRRAGDSIAPHTLEVAAIWAVLTRLEEAKNQNIHLTQKLRLYNGQLVPGFTEKDAQDLRQDAPREGMRGISPRYIQDNISLALTERGSLSPVTLLRELESGLAGNSLIDNEKDRGRYRELLTYARSEYEEIIKREVHSAVCSDDTALQALCANYLENVSAYVTTQKAGISSYEARTKGIQHPNEELMRSIEVRLEISEARKDDFRQEIVHYLESVVSRGERFDYNNRSRLKDALEKQLFEGVKDQIKLGNASHTTTTPELERQLSRIKQRLIESFGYSQASATEVLNLVSDIYSRGELRPVKAA